MITARGTLLARLNEASIGLSTKEVLEQSNSFVFKGDTLTTFNDDIMVRVANPLDFDVVVNATDMMAILSKIPDEEVEITRVEGEIRIKGKRRKAGISCTTDIHLPIDAVPRPDEWHRLEDGTMAAMQQAARTCGQDETKYLTTCVHVTPDCVEACDDYRLLRVDGKTGFTESVLVHAAIVAKLEGIELKSVCIAKGWIHFKPPATQRYHYAVTTGNYIKDVDKLLIMRDSEQVVLPAKLPEIVERAEVFHTAAYDAKINVQIGSDGEMKITSRKDTGWYREQRKIRYGGRPLNFDINPNLVEILKRTREVEIDDRRMKIVVRQDTVCDGGNCQG